jgi:hypothetical protein
VISTGGGGGVVELLLGVSSGTAAVEPVELVCPVAPIPEVQPASSTAAAATIRAAAGRRWPLPIPGMRSSAFDKLTRPAHRRAPYPLWSL